MEERRVIVSDYPGYVRNVHPRSFVNQLMSWGLLQKDEIRFKRIAGNINLSNWTLRDRVFEIWKSHFYLSDDDKKFIDETVKYFSKL